MTPTPEQIMAARFAYDKLTRFVKGFASHPTIKMAEEMACLQVLGELIPPLPEPERPRLTPAEDLAHRLIGNYNTNGMHRARIEAIHATRAEIIALLEWELNLKHTDSMYRLGAGDVCNRLIKELREADKP